MLTEVQKQLERAFPTRKLMFPVTTTLEIRQELKAATVSFLYNGWMGKNYAFNTFDYNLHLRIVIVVRWE